jgi:E3 ubiquitin-protein ligase RNF14
MKHPKPIDPMTDDVDSSDEEEGFAFDPNGDEAQLPPMADRVAICEDCNYAFCSVCKKGWHGELVRCFPRRDAELSAEEKATEEYLRLYTSPCPTCDAPCQKRLGCNHMICFKCSTHFCYLCSSWLCEDNPYRHFNDTNSQCYNRLWDLEGGDGIDPEGAEALHRIPNDLVEFDEPSDDEDAPVLEFHERDDEIARRRRPPPPAPVPPRVNQAAGGHRARGDDANGLDAAGRAAAAERQAQARAIAEVRARPVADRPRQNDGQAAGRIHRPGLQRFLDLVQNDREDEWDSDELDDDF